MRIARQRKWVVVPWSARKAKAAVLERKTRNPFAARLSRNSGSQRSMVPRSASSLVARQRPSAIRLPCRDNLSVRLDGNGICLVSADREIGGHLAEAGVERAVAVVARQREIETCVEN